MSGLGQKCPHSQPHFGHFSNSINTCFVIFLGEGRDFGGLHISHFLGFLSKLSFA